MKRSAFAAVIERHIQQAQQSATENKRLRNVILLPCALFFSIALKWSETEPSEVGDND